MTKIPIISLSIAKGTRTPGEQVSGILDYNVTEGAEKGVEAITVSLRGEMNVWFTTGSGENSRKHTQKEILFEQELTLWKIGSDLPPHNSGIASFPFTLTILDKDMPPSYYGGTKDDGASVVYYVHAVGVRKQWYKRNIRVNEIFPFIPFDRTIAPTYSLPSWAGEWSTTRVIDKVRKGLFSHSGLVTVEFMLPTMPSIPLFRPVPIRIKVVCQSKPLPLSSASDPSTFEFPRNPTPSDLDLTLHSRLEMEASCNYSASRHSASSYVKRAIESDLGLQAGFGTPEDVNQRGVWGRNIKLETVPPKWEVSQEDPNKGVWKEEVMFSSILSIRCPPPFKTGKYGSGLTTVQSLSTTLSLILVIDFPGLGNSVRLNIRTLPLTSGIAPPRLEPIYPPSTYMSTAPPYSPPPPQQVPSEGVAFLVPDIHIPTPSVLPNPSASPQPLMGTDYRPVHELDLPPSYFDIVSRDLGLEDETDEKK